jgi:hypothetical protein
LEERARLDLPHFRKYPHWIFARLYKDPTRCEATARRVGFKCHYAPRWQIWLWRAKQEYYRATGDEAAAIVKDTIGQSLAYCYGRVTKADADTAKVPTLDEARRIASNIAKLPELLRKQSARARCGERPPLPKVLT